MKTPDDYFTDWESHVFGYGYGTGEDHTIPALRKFLLACPSSGNYHYTILEAELGPVVAWLLINILCHEIIDYGTSPRFGWLTPQGVALRAFVDSKTDDELIELTARDSEYIYCHPDACNCGPNGYEEGRLCNNPFWRTNR